jgi:hypothetical protein
VEARATAPIARIVAGVAALIAGVVLGIAVDWVVGVALALVGAGLLLPFTDDGDDRETAWDSTGLGGGDGGGT